MCGEIDVVGTRGGEGESRAGRGDKGGVGVCVWCGEYDVDDDDGCVDIVIGGEWSEVDDGGGDG